MTELRVNDTAITDVGLDAIGKSFQENKSLQMVVTDTSGVTQNGLQKLQRSLEKVKIKQTGPALP